MTLIHTILQDFAQDLQNKGASENTIKNYLADIQMFLRFITPNGETISLNTLPQIMTPEKISQYQQHLISTYPHSTTKRRLSSLKKFLDFILPTPPPSLPLSVSVVTKTNKKYPSVLLVSLTIAIAIISIVTLTLLMIKINTTPIADPTANANINL